MDDRYVKIRKRDIILLAGLVTLCAAVCIVTHLAGRMKKQGNYVRIAVDSAVIKQIPIDKDEVYDVSNSYGRNRVVIKNKRVYVESADCPDKICVSHVPIGREGEQIICVPHHLIVSVVVE